MTNARRAAGPSRDADSERLGALGGVVLLAVFLCGCGGSSEATRAGDRLESEVARLRAQTAALSERVDALEMQGGGLRGYRAPADSPDRPPLDVVRVVPDRGGSAGDGGRESDEERTVLRSTSSGSVSIDEARREDRDAIAQTEFRRAHELLTAKKLDQALSAFAAFVVRFPEHPRALDATFHRGECYAQKGDHARAVEQFEAVVAQKPKSPRAADALSALVRSYERLGDTSSAERTKRQLSTSFPERTAP